MQIVHASFRIKVSPENRSTTEVCRGGKISISDNTFDNNSFSGPRLNVIVIITENISIATLEAN